MRAGDVQALDALARRYGPELVAVARRCCRSAADVEDAVQQAFVEASAHITSYRGDGAPVAWISRLVARSCYRMNRGRKNDPRLHDDLGEHSLVSSDRDPEAEAIRTELGARLSGALMTLKRTDRLVLLLSVEGWTGAEIAEEFGLTDNAVRSRLKRARAQLRILLGDDTDLLDDGTTEHGRERLSEERASG